MNISETYEQFRQWVREYTAQVSQERRQEIERKCFGIFMKTLFSSKL